MSEQASDPAVRPTNASQAATSAGKVGFAPRGVPQIVGVNRIGLWSLYMKEVRRFLKVQTQTIWAPAVTTLLFLIIFTVAL
ncbi:MAG: multidrug ABC transporter permease, partial [Pseudomonadota bacterium]